MRLTIPGAPGTPRRPRAPGLQTGTGLAVSERRSPFEWELHVRGGWRGLAAGLSCAPYPKPPWRCSEPPVLPWRHHAGSRGLRAGLGGRGARCRISDLHSVDAEVGTHGGRGVDRAAVPGRRAGSRRAHGVPRRVPPLQGALGHGGAREPHGPAALRRLRRRRDVPGRPQLRRGDQGDGGRADPQGGGLAARARVPAAVAGAPGVGGHPVHPRPVPPGPRIHSDVGRVRPDPAAVVAGSGPRQRRHDRPAADRTHPAVPAGRVGGRRVLRRVPRAHVPVVRGNAARLCHGRGRTDERGLPMTRRAAAGFTLVELIIVMAIIGLLATLVVPKFAARDRALVATMKTDLRNLMTQEEARKIDSGSYVTSFPPTIWGPSVGVTGPTISLTPDGWTASVGHVSSPRTCAIFVGSTPLAPATQEGVPTCTPRRPTMAFGIMTCTPTLPSTSS